MFKITSPDNAILVNFGTGSPTLKNVNPAVKGGGIISEPGQSASNALQALSRD
jgi:hypothetical protein